MMAQQRDDMHFQTMHGAGVLKRRANMLLCVLSVLYGIVFVGQFYILEEWYGFLYWVVQSALIGSVADWFAVTALFRRPLGVSFHTELIPRNKQRLINGLVKMVETKLLTYEQCESMINRIRFVPLVDRYITSDTGRITIRQTIRSLVIHVWSERSEREWAVWGAERLRQFLHTQSIVGPMQQFLTNISQHNHHEEIVIKAIKKLRTAIMTPAVESWLVRLIQEEIDSNKKTLFSVLAIGLAEDMNVINARDMARSMIQEIGEVLEEWQRPRSVGRIAWMRQWTEPLQAMTGDSVVRSTLRKTIDDLIDEEDWEDILERCVCPHITELVESYGDSEISQSLPHILEQAIQDIWGKYRNDAVTVNGLEDALRHMSLHVLSKSHGLIGIVVKEVLEGLSTEKFIYFVESKVEDDLSWIRINGALVGGVCGGVVWVFLQFVYDPLLRIVGL